jgi:hypothetical protein
MPCEQITMDLKPFIARLRILIELFTNGRSQNEAGTGQSRIFAMSDFDRTQGCTIPCLFRFRTGALFVFAPRQKCLATQLAWYNATG